jgi:hypothetical protein
LERWEKVILALRRFGLLVKTWTVTFREQPRLCREIDFNEYVKTLAAMKRATKIQMSWKIWNNDGERTFG